MGAAGNQSLADLIRRHLTAKNAHDLPGTLATLHPECRFDDFATGQSWQGHDGATAHYRQSWATFDVEVRRGANQRACWTDDDSYIAEATWHGRHIGRFRGIERWAPPSCSPSWCSCRSATGR